MVFFAAGFALLCGCSSEPRSSLVEVPNWFAPHTTFHSLMKPPGAGTFRVTYRPRDFSEPAELRSARDKYISARIITQLSEAGMTYVDMNDPGWMTVDYEVTYSYRTRPSSWPAPEGGFDHIFSIDIDKNQEGRLWHGTVPEPVPKEMAKVTGMTTVLMDPDMTQWSGEAEIRFYQDHDISEVFSTLIHALLDNFPKNDNQGSQGP